MEDRTDDARTIEEAVDGPADPDTPESKAVVQIRSGLLHEYLDALTSPARSDGAAKASGPAFYDRLNALVRAARREALIEERARQRRKRMQRMQSWSRERRGGGL